MPSIHDTSDLDHGYSITLDELIVLVIKWHHESCVNDGMVKGTVCLEPKGTARHTIDERCMAHHMMDMI